MDLNERVKKFLKEQGIDEKTISTASDDSLFKIADTLAFNCWMISTSINEVGEAIRREIELL